MGVVVLLSCVSKKQPFSARAEELYTSPLFTKSLSYARSLRPDKIFVLSALHGLLGLDEVVAPYNLTLNDLGVAARRAWADTVLDSLREHTDVDHDTFIFLAGKRYREFLVPHIRHVQVPLAGLGIGQQLSWLTRRNT